MHGAVVDCGSVCKRRLLALSLSTSFRRPHSGARLLYHFTHCGHAPVVCVCVCCRAGGLHRHSSSAPRAPSPCTRTRNAPPRRHADPTAHLCRSQSAACTSRLHHLAGRLPVPARIARAARPRPAATTLGMATGQASTMGHRSSPPTSCHWHAGSTGGLSPNCASTCSGGADRPAGTLVAASSASLRVPPPASPAGSGWCSAPCRRGRQTPHLSAAARFGPCPCCPSPAGPPGCRSGSPARTQR